MADPQTTNKFLYQPARGADVGTWDTPVNSNTGVIDNSFGGTATVALTNSNVVLSGSQYQCVFLNFTGALSANIAITMPAVGSFYTIQNLTSNTSAFYITLGTTVAGSQSIGIPPGIPVDIMTDGSNVKFRNFGEVGTYWDYAGSSTPSWLSACSVPPRLLADGTTFSSATYPVLATILGGTTLPDSKGRARSALNQGSNRLLSSNNGVDGNTFLAGGGGSVTLAQANMPSYNLTVIDPGHLHKITAGVPGNWNLFTGGGSANYLNAGGTDLGNTNPAVTNITVNSGGGGIATTLATPTYISGLTFIRAA